MNVYLVKLTITSNHYEKVNRVLIRAKGHFQASRYGIYLESYNPKNLDWTENRVVELDKQFSYLASSQKVKFSDIDTLSQYLPIYTASDVELKSSGNFKECHPKL